MTALKPIAGSDFVCLRDGTIIAVDISIEISVDKFYRKFEEEIKGKISERVNTFSGLNNWWFGKDLKSADLIKALSDIAEIQSITVDFETGITGNSGETVTTDYNEIIRFDDTSIAFMYT